MRWKCTELFFLQGSVKKLNRGHAHPPFQPKQPTYPPPSLSYMENLVFKPQSTATTHPHPKGAGACTPVYFWWIKIKCIKTNIDKYELKKKSSLRWRTEISKIDEKHLMVILEKAVHQVRYSKFMSIGSVLWQTTVRCFSNNWIYHIQYDILTENYFG